MKLFDATRERFARARASHALPRRMPPSFARTGDIVARAHQAQDLLLRDGEIVFGALLMHADALTEPGTADAGAFVLYTHDEATNASPPTIESIADWMRDNIGKKTPHAGMTRICEALESGSPIPRTPVPRGLTAGVQYYVCAIAVRRIDLPGGRLRSTFLPLLAEREIEYVLALPLPLWADDLVAAWIDRGA